MPPRSSRRSTRTRAPCIESEGLLDQALVEAGRNGLYHLTNAGSCSWYEFAGAIFELAGVKAELSPITSREFGAAARRPAYSVLADTAYARVGLPPLRPWREALAAYLDERRQRS